MKNVRVSQETNIDLLRKKAEVLENENERLSQRIGLLLTENLLLKGMSIEQAAFNLPGLLAQVTDRPRSRLTRPGGERRAHDYDPKNNDGEGAAQTGHGPTPQPKLEVQRVVVDLDEADKICTACGKPLKKWDGQEDTVEVVDLIERKWVVKQCILTKYRCACGGCVETAAAPDRLIPGGRYLPSVAIASAADKYLNQIPLDRQVRIAERQDIELTTQTLWDQTQASHVPLGSTLRLKRRSQPRLDRRYWETMPGW